VLYQYKEYPRYVYHATLAAMQVLDAIAHAELGPDWHPSQAAAADAKAQADAAIADAKEIELRMKALWSAPVADVLAKLKDATPEVLAEVKAYEEQNPKPRKSLLEAVTASLAAFGGK
jgi:hypothetical protein